MQTTGGGCFSNCLDDVMPKKILVVEDETPMTPEDWKYIGFQDGFDEANKSYDEMIDWVYAVCNKQRNLGRRKGFQTHSGNGTTPELSMITDKDDLWVSIGFAQSTWLNAAKVLVK